MTLKDSIRFQLGSLTRKLELESFFRRIYWNHAEFYLRRHSSYFLKGAWLRRSSVTSDFTPFWSDIDLTVIVDAQIIFQDQAFKNDLLVKDIQLIDQRFFKDWQEVGGLRNRQMPNWRSIVQKTLPALTPPHHQDSSFLAFELAHEVFLLYRQLESKLYTHFNSPSPLHQLSLHKLMAEMERLKTFWETRNDAILFLPRETFLQEDLRAFLKSQEGFWQNLLDHLKHPLNTFDLAPLILSSGKLDKTLALEIEGKQVVLLNDWCCLEKAYIRPNFFYASATFIRLIKGVGVQEQTLLNQLAQEKGSYYFRFNRQRLAHDLLSALIFVPGSESIHYYCLWNIQEFLFLFGLSVPRWKDIQASWTLNRTLGLDLSCRKALTLECLELLNSLR